MKNKQAVVNSTYFSFIRGPVPVFTGGFLAVVSVKVFFLVVGVRLLNLLSQGLIGEELLSASTYGCVTSPWTISSS